MNDKQLEQLSERVREAKGAVDEGDSKRGMTLMKKVFGEMARKGVVSAHAHWVMAIACDLSGEVEMAFQEIRKSIELDPLAAPFDSTTVGKAG